MTNEQIEINKKKRWNVIWKSLLIEFLFIGVAIYYKAYLLVLLPALINVLIMIPFLDEKYPIKEK